MPYALCLVPKRRRDASKRTRNRSAGALLALCLMPYVLCLMPYALCLNAGETPLSAHATALQERSLEKLQGKIGTPFT
jgi:hypothetical protein